MCFTVGFGPSDLLSSGSLSLRLSARYFLPHPTAPVDRNSEYELFMVVVFDSEGRWERTLHACAPRLSAFSSGLVDLCLSESCPRPEVCGLRVVSPFQRSYHVFCPVCSLSFFVQDTEGKKHAQTGQSARDRAELRRTKPGTRWTRIQSSWLLVLVDDPSQPPLEKADSNVWAWGTEK